MEKHAAENAASAIAYIEAHLAGRLDLESVAGAVHYSKYHLHHMFARAVGMTPHAYIRRRQLTEAARQLVYSERPILEIALDAGYESQQAFTGAFKVMYKQTPLEYRMNGAFYPLQLRLSLHHSPGMTRTEIARAVPADIAEWMELAEQAVDGFPHFEESAYLQCLRRSVEQGQALVLRSGGILVGAAAFSRRAGSIDFLGVHPQYRRHGAAKVLVEHLRQNEFPGQAVSITTFRAGDRADPGQRAACQRLGFSEGELLTEFGYPTQRMLLPPCRGGAAR